MSISSIPSTTTGRQADQIGETPRQMFRRLLPRQLEAADREAMQFRRKMPKRWALSLSEIWPNDEDRIVCIVVDVDAEPGEQIDFLTGEPIRVNVAATTWIDAGVAPPNIVVENPVSGHAHLVWILAEPIFMETQARAPRYAAAIQRALTRAIPGADLSYHWPNASMHNPFAERYSVREVNPTPYKLDDLAAGLDLDSNSVRRSAFAVDSADIVATAHGYRNEGLFRHLLWVAPRIMSRCKTDDVYEDRVREYAVSVNSTFLPPMDTKEMDTVATRVATIYRPFVRRDRAAELKAKRHAEGRTRTAYEAPTREREREAHRLRALGKTVREIAEMLKVGMRTVKRYLSKLIDPVIGVIRIQSNPTPRAPFGDSGHPNMGLKRVEIAHGASRLTLLRIGYVCWEDVRRRERSLPTPRPANFVANADTIAGRNTGEARPSSIRS